MADESDILQRFVFDQTAVRGEIVRLRNSYQTVVKQQPYPPQLQNWLGEALAAAVLLSATIKYQGLLILQAQSDGVLNTLVAHSTNQCHIRGLAKWDETTELPLTFAEAVGKGQLGITIKPDEGKQYQGVVTLAGESLATALEDYFHQSEQIPSFLFLAANSTIAAGLLLQTMPQNTDTVYDYFWEHIVKLAQTLTCEELLTLPNETLLKRLYHEENIILFDSDTVSFRCTCSTEKSEQVVQTLPYNEAQALLKEYKHVIVTCEFCNHPYQFDEVDIARVYAHNSLLAPPDIQ